MGVFGATVVKRESQIEVSSRKLKLSLEVLDPEWKVNLRDVERLWVTLKFMVTDHEGVNELHRTVASEQPLRNGGEGIQRVRPITSG